MNQATVYKNAVEAAFRSMKETTRMDDLWAKAIPLGEDAGYLLPVCELHTADSELIETFGRWREDSAHVYPTQFPVTFEGTKNWLRKRLLDVPDRILFLIVDPLGKPVGHVGFASAINDDGLMELDNLLRGSLRGHREIARLAVEALLNWATETMAPQGFYLRVLSSLKHVIRLDERIGFKESKRIPLRKTVDGECISFNECAPDDQEQPDEWFVRMEYARAA
jgi:RimJ/RimL family protein N-acetyltransferase